MVEKKYLKFFMKICYFGIYQKDYCRAKNTIIGLRKCGVEVIEVQDRTPGFKKFWNLYKQHREIRNNYDIMLVGFPGQIIMPFAKLISKKPIVFDAFASMYDGNVFDRKNCSPYSLKALWYYCMDWLSCALADRVLLDTKEHAQYFIKTFRMNSKKLIVVYHGIDDNVYHPLNVQKNEKCFLAVFYGYITPLHGIEYVLGAMKKLEKENIRLWIIGGGQDYKKMKEFATNELKLSNVDFFPVMVPEKLMNFIGSVHVGLGIFGNTDKVNRVIPNKVYELMAMGISVITSDTPAIREKFTHRENVYLCKRADIDAIADAIVDIKNNQELRDHISKKALLCIKENLTPIILGTQLLKDLEEV
ncbi:MAG: Glycosyl transferase group 1 [Parcubacteria group bacterium GW2011_GWA2_38_13]|nr:MAG: Glycosyl transferase group 1 [Parcubacteria group bacterium GW2011_GWA2_38_13]